MSEVNLDPAFEDADAFYKTLVRAIDAAGEEAGVRLLVRLVLILANQVGDEAVLESAIAEAARGADAKRAEDAGSREVT
jgi:hypothetical protein